MINVMFFRPERNIEAGFDALFFYCCWQAEVRNRWGREIYNRASDAP